MKSGTPPPLSDSPDQELQEEVRHCLSIMKYNPRTSPDDRTIASPKGLGTVEARMVDAQHKSSTFNLLFILELLDALTQGILVLPSVAF